MNIENEIEILEQKAKFKLTQTERNKFRGDLERFKKAFKLFESINLDDGVEEAYTPFKITNTFLRDDEYVENNSLNFLKNSKKFKEGFIVIKNINHEIRKESS